MSKEIMTVDLHCHPNLKSFNSGHPLPKYGMWENIHHNIESKFAKTISEQSAHVLKESQTNLYALAEGNVRIFNVSLYPIERGFLHLRNIPKALIGKNKINILQEVITGFDIERIVHLKKYDDYFQDLQDEYAFIEKAQGKSPDGKYEFVLVNNYAELEAALKKKNTLIGIVSIEGGHALGTGRETTESLSTEKLLELVTERISIIKKWKNPPLTINLAHHFWNQLCGHATSFKAPINSIVNQNKGKNKGITEAGWQVIRQLLSRENGKRILIDTKHMSIAARKEYYDFIANYNFLNPQDIIPIISSHAGVNGIQTMEGSIRENDLPRKARWQRFFKWSINLSNEEVRIIHQSKGLIGIMMDRGMLGGLKAIKKIVEIEDTHKKRLEYCKLFWDNAFQIAKAVKEKSAWDVVALGTDFDGTITHMEPYHSSAKIPDLQKDLIAYLEKTNYQKDLWYDYTPEQLVEKIMHQNALDFYKKFFV